VEPRLFADRLWPGKRVELEELGGGITNRNYKATVDGESFVVRVGGKDTHLLGIDREVEHAASLAAAEAGVGPEVVTFVEPEGWLVTRFVDGRPVPPEEMREPAWIDRAAAAIRAFHERPRIPGRFDSFRVVEGYREIAERHGVRIPDTYGWAKERADEIERMRGPVPECPCHNDLLNANFIAHGRGLRIVDWEYAGMGDRFFDLANFSVNHELAQSENEALLRAYLGEARDADLARLRLMRFMSDFREAMWGVVQQGISELDFDFAGYAEQHFERLEQAGRDPAFAEALATVAKSGPPAGYSRARLTSGPDPPPARRSG
jgi:thiamine kinase-like enzyme